MSGPKEKPHAGGRGASDCADIEDGSSEEHSPLQASAVFLARMAINAAQSQLNAYGLATDDPSRGIVEAADLLDAAEQRLAECSDVRKGDAEKGARGGGE